jgi:hypothetical protein
MQCWLALEILDAFHPLAMMTHHFGMKFSGWKVLGEFGANTIHGGDGTTPCFLGHLEACLWSSKGCQPELAELLYSHSFETHFIMY